MEGLEGIQVLIVPVLVILGVLLLVSIKVVNEWERLAILTLGKFSGMKGPGLVLILPIIQVVASRIDTRVMTSQFNAETTLTKDGVSVTVQAVLFWRVLDAKRATLSVVNYKQATDLAAQTTLRDIIGRVTLANILSNLHELDEKLKEVIETKVQNWGIEAISVEIRDVSIPRELQEVMSRAAQAEREKQARIIYGEAEIEAAQKYVTAARIYAEEPHAMQLRAMTIMYEAVKSDQNTIIMVPTNVTEAFNSAAFAASMNSAQNINNVTEEAKKIEG